MKEKNNCTILCKIISYFKLRIIGLYHLVFLYITNVYNLQTVPFKNKLKYKSRKLGTLLQF